MFKNWREFNLILWGWERLRKRLTNKINILSSVHGLAGMAFLSLPFSLCWKMYFCFSCTGSPLASSTTLRSAQLTSTFAGPSHCKYRASILGDCIGRHWIEDMEQRSPKSSVDNQAYALNHPKARGHHAMSALTKDRTMLHNLNSGGKLWGRVSRSGAKTLLALHCMLLNRRGWQLALWEPSYADS